MDGNGSLNLRNWGFLEPEPAAFKGNLGLQLMSNMNGKSLFSGVRDHHHYQYHHPYQAHSTVMAPSINLGPYHHHRVGGFLESSTPMDYMREVYNREKYINVLTNSHQHHPQLCYGAFPETSSSHSVEMIHQSNFLDNDNVCRQEVENCETREAVGTDKKRGNGKILKSPKAKKPKKAPKPPREDCGRSLHRPRAPKKAAEIFINGRSLDLSKFPIPVCTCTETAQFCYRWGAGGWQSACCTTGMSVYPLPMSTKRRGARIPGRKMSLGAFRKVLEKLDSEGFDLSKSIDLKKHWAKHGTNKFVTIR